MTETSLPKLHCVACGTDHTQPFRFCPQCGAELSHTETVNPLPADTPQEDIQVQIHSEIDDLKSMASAFGIERIRDGTWFNEFIRSMLASYAERIISGGGIALFRSKYPGLTRDQIAEKLCELATRYAALAGGASGATASAAFAATIGTAGGTGVIAVPAGVMAIIAEMLYTTRLQVRLVYDLSIIYGCPIDTSDPEDLYKAFCMAYGVAFAAGNVGATVKALTPEIARAQLRQLIQGNTAAIQHVAIQLLGPRIGHEITQRSILRTAVPVVGIGISATWNFVSTNEIATTARYGLSVIGRLRDAVAPLIGQLAEHPGYTEVVLESMLNVITADGRCDQYEQELFSWLVRQIKPAPDVVTKIEDRTSLVATAVEEQLQTIDDPGLRLAIADSLQVVTVADGEVAEAEIQVLRRQLSALQQVLDLDRLHELAKRFKRPKSWTDQAADTVSSIASSAGATISGWFGWHARK